MKNWCYVSVSGYEQYQPGFQKFALARVESSNKFYNFVDLQDFVQHCPDLYQTITSQFGKLLGLSVLKITKEQIVSSLGEKFIHVDSGKQTARLNWPILNPSSVVTKHFDVVDAEYVPPRHFHNPLTKDYIEFYNAKSCTEVSSVCVDQPTVFNVKTPHGMFQSGDAWPRVIASFNFEDDVVLKKYLEE